MSPLCQTHIAPRAAQPHGAVLPAARLRLRRVLLVQLEEYVAPRRHLHRVRLLLVLFGQLGRARAPLRRGDDRALRARTRTAAWSRSRATTATCCSTSCAAAFRCSASSRRPTSPRSRAEGHSDDGAFFGRDDGARDRAPRTARRPAPRQQRARARAGPQRLRRRHEDPAEAAAASSRWSFRTYAADGRRTSSTPSTTSTSRTSRSSRSRRSSRAHGLTLFDVEEIADARRIAANLRAPRRERRAAGYAGAWRRCASARATTGFARLETYAAFAEQVKETKREAARVPDRGQARRQDGRRLWRAGQGQHAAELLRHPHRTSSTTRSIAVRTSRASSRPGRTSRFSRPERIRETRPDYVLILPWNLKDEIVGQLPTSANGAASSSCPIPEGEGFSSHHANSADRHRGLHRLARGSDPRRARPRGHRPRHGLLP